MNFNQFEEVVSTVTAVVPLTVGGLRYVIKPIVTKQVKIAIAEQNKYLRRLMRDHILYDHGKRPRHLITEDEANE
jgi:hypothetical protein